MNINLRCIFIAFLCLFSLSLSAQETIDGVLLNKTTREPIEGSHILNLSKKAMAVSNDKGEFIIEAQAFDTLLISNVNYERRQFVLEGINSLVILLQPLIVQLEEVEVSNIPKNSSVFSDKLKALSNKETENFRLYGVEPSKPQAEIPPLFQEDNSLRFWENGNILPPTAIDIYVIPKLFNKKYKSKMKYYSLKAEEKEILIRQKKFNRAFVKQYAPLEGELLTDFINFMAIENSFIDQSSEYEIALFIKQKYNEFMNFE